MTVNTFDGISLHIEWEASGAKGYSLIEPHMIANDARGTNHHARAMVYSEVITYCGGRMYVDASIAMGHLGDDTRYERYPQQIQCMS